MTWTPPGQPNSVCGSGSATTSAATLPTSDHVVEQVVVQADDANDDFILVGNATTQTLKLEPGNAITLPCERVQEVYVKASSGTQSFAYFGR